MNWNARMVSKSIPDPWAMPFTSWSRPGVHFSIEGMKSVSAKNFVMRASGSILDWAAIPDFHTATISWIFSFNILPWTTPRSKGTTRSILACLLTSSREGSIFLIVPPS